MKTLTEAQKEWARGQGLTEEEAQEIIAEAKDEERLDRETYRTMSEAEREAHDNL